MTEEAILNDNKSYKKGTKRHVSEDNFVSNKDPNKASNIKEKKSKFDLKNVDKKSPHTFQNLKNTYFENEFTAQSRLVTEDSPREKYKRRSGQDKTTFHFGQRKLMLSEIEFLTNVTNDVYLENIKKKLCLIYAGAEPGNFFLNK